MNFTLQKIKNWVIYGVGYGFFTGFAVGCFPNKLHIRFEEQKIYSLPIPLISGLIGCTGVICSPLLVANYICNGTYFEKIVDKYDINLKRRHQYDTRHNKYAYPSSFIINIKRKVFKPIV
jgi:hypothetical protein